MFKKLFSAKVDRSASQRWLLVGLGNPGEQYAGTRHNIGFQVIHYLAESGGIPCKAEKKFKALLGSGVLVEQPVLLAQPLTFMNLSGEAVGKLLHYYQIPSSQLLVIYDDTALPFGKLRLRTGGSAGGHNGMKSIIQHLGGSEDFPRLRVGIGAPQGQRPLHDHVLSAFTSAEQQRLDAILSACGDAIKVLFLEGMEAAMTRFNGQDFIESSR